MGSNLAPPSDTQGLQAANRRNTNFLRLNHLVLLASSLLGGWSYPMLQAFVIIEMIFMAIGTAFFHPERSVANRIWYAFMAALWPIFLGTFVIFGYGAVVGSKDFPYDMIRQNEHIDPLALYCVVGCLALSLAAPFWRAKSSANPILSWTKSEIGMGRATLTVMGLMIFISFFLAMPLVRMLRHFGIPVNVDALLITITVLLRYATASDMSRLSESDWNEMSQQDSTIGNDQAAKTVRL